MTRQEYLEIVKELDWQVGDKVTLIRRPTRDECNANGSGIASYFSTLPIGKVYTITEISHRKNCTINHSAAFFPQFCFAEFSDKHPLKYYTKSKFKEFDTKVKELYGHS